MKELGFVTQHEIKIKPSCNQGFVISIGCATIVAASKEELIDILNLYIIDPKGWAKKYNDLEGSPVGVDMPERASPEPSNINQPTSEDA